VLAYEKGVRLTVEMPPGSVLTKLSTAALPEALSVSASNTRVDTLSVLMERERHT
jgi:malonate decarboxylase epsilon subunit